LPICELDKLLAAVRKPTLTRIDTTLASTILLYSFFRSASLCSFYRHCLR